MYSKRKKKSFIMMVKYHSHGYMCGFMHFVIIRLYVFIMFFVNAPPSNCNIPLHAVVVSCFVML